MFNFLKRRELQEIERLKSQNAEAQNEIEKLRSHFVLDKEKLNTADTLSKELLSVIADLRHKETDAKHRIEDLLMQINDLKSCAIDKKTDRIEDDELSDYFRKMATMPDDDEYGTTPNVQAPKPRSKKTIQDNDSADPNVVDGVILDKDNPEFYRAVELVRKGYPLIYLTGKAGSGKSTFLKYIRQLRNKNTIVLAPTGVAAVNVQGVTIHSFFKLPPSVFMPNDSRLREMAQSGDWKSISDYFPYSRRRIDGIDAIDMLIIDEVSMVRCDLLDTVDLLLRHFRRNNAPFGGIQTILIGDAFQLAPIAKEDEWIILKEYYETPFFFSSNVIRNTPIKYIELSKIYRQSDIDFVDLLNKIRTGAVSDKDVEMLNSKYQPDFKPQIGDEHIILTTHNSFVREYNLERLDELKSDIKYYDAVVEGNFHEKIMPTDEHLGLKIGAQVMFVKNDKLGRYYNGMIGVVKNMSDNIITVVSGGKDIEVGPEKWENKVYTWDRIKSKIEDTNKGKFEQFPLKLAWAITVHKSQGLGFDRVVADLSESFAPGQIYVALSRCTSFDGLKLTSKIPKNAIMTDPYVLEFSRQYATKKAPNRRKKGA